MWQCAKEFTLRPAGENGPSAAELSCLPATAWSADRLPDTERLLWDMLPGQKREFNPLSQSQDGNLLYVSQEYEIKSAMCLIEHVTCTHGCTSVHLKQMSRLRAKKGHQLSQRALNYFRGCNEMKIKMKNLNSGGSHTDAKGDSSVPSSPARCSAGTRRRVKTLSSFFTHKHINNYHQRHRIISTLPSLVPCRSQTYPPFQEVLRCLINCLLCFFVHLLLQHCH